jgi:hypothetical protein
LQLIKSNLETFAEPSEPTASSSKRAKSSYRHETLQEARRLKNLRMVDGSDAATSLDLDANVRTRGVRGAGNLAGKDKASFTVWRWSVLAYADVSFIIVYRPWTRRR